MEVGKKANGRGEAVPASPRVQASKSEESHANPFAGRAGTGPASCFWILSPIARPMRRGPVSNEGWT